MNVLYGHNDAVVAFVGQLLPGGERGFGACQTIGALDNEGRLIAGVVYHNYDPDAKIIEMSGAGIDPHFLTRRFINAMFDYRFLGVGCLMVVFRARIDNERLLRQLAWYGCTFHRIPRLYGREVDGVVATLTDDEWANNKINSKRFAREAA